MDKSNFFLCVGPEKTGTTWLYENLNKHKEVSLPRVKELRFFWEKDFLSGSGPFYNLFGGHWHHKSQRIRFRSEIKQHIKSAFRGQLSLAELKWDLRHFFLPRTDEWYDSLFPAEGCTGDISPHNAFLELKSIVSIKKKYPNAKIIISLRDPIDREWSRAKMNLVKKRKISSVEDVDNSNFIRHISEPMQVSLNNYTDLVNKWTKVYGSQSIFVLYFDDLDLFPQKTFDNICNFLKIEESRIDGIERKVNSGLREQMPLEVYQKLIELNFSFIQQFYKNYPSKVSKGWLEKHENFIKNEP